MDEEGKRTFEAGAWKLSVEAPEEEDYTIMTFQKGSGEETFTRVVRNCGGDVMSIPSCLISLMYDEEISEEDLRRDEDLIELFEKSSWGMKSDGLCKLILHDSIDQQERTIKLYEYSSKFIRKYLGMN